MKTITNYNKNKIKFIDFSESFNLAKNKLEFINLKHSFCKKDFNKIDSYINANEEKIVLKSLDKDIFYSAFKQYIASETVDYKYCRFYCRILKFVETKDFLNSFVDLQITDKERNLVKERLAYFKVLYDNKLQGCKSIQGIIRNEDFIIFDGVHRAVLYYMLDNSNLNFDIVI
jgi:asparagine synthetase A